MKGEIVVLIAPSQTADTPTSDKDVDAILKSLLEEMSASKAAKEAAKMTGLQKSDLYARLLTFKNDNA